MISPRKASNTIDNLKSPDSNRSPSSSVSLTSHPQSPSVSSISASQTVFSSSSSFNPNTDYVVVPVTHSRLVDLLNLERRKRLKLRAAFQRDISNSQKTFDALEKRLNRKVKHMQTKVGQQIWQSLIRKIPVLEAQLEQCVQRQHKVFQQMTDNANALKRIERMINELVQASAQSIATNEANEDTFYCIHVPCTEETVRMMSEAPIDVRSVRFPAENKFK